MSQAESPPHFKNLNLDGRHKQKKKLDMNTNQIREA